MAVLPGFVAAAALTALVDDARSLVPLAHHSVSKGTAYLAAPVDDVPEGHPRRAIVDSSLGAVAYDLFPASSPIRALYEWGPLMAFVAELLDEPVLHHYADPFGALNLAVMHDGDVLGWHFDQTDFVVSIALQQSEAGGDFEAVPRLRSADDERYDTVAAVLAGDVSMPVTTMAMDPGTLMVFQGRRSLHRVSPVSGPTPRLVALLAYDTKPGTDSTDRLKLSRYGRRP